MSGESNEQRFVDLKKVLEKATTDEENQLLSHGEENGNGPLLGDLLRTHENYDDARDEAVQKGINLQEELQKMKQRLGEAKAADPNSSQPAPDQSAAPAQPTPANPNEPVKPELGTTSPEAKTPEGKDAPKADPNAEDVSAASIEKDLQKLISEAAGFEGAKRKNTFLPNNPFGRKGKTELETEFTGLHSKREHIDALSKARNELEDLKNNQAKLGAADYQAQLDALNNEVKDLKEDGAYYAEQNKYQKRFDEVYSDQGATQGKHGPQKGAIAIVDGKIKIVHGKESSLWAAKFKMRKGAFEKAIDAQVAEVNNDPAKLEKYGVKDGNALIVIDQGSGKNGLLREIDKDVLNDITQNSSNTRFKAKDIEKALLKAKGPDGKNKYTPEEAKKLAEGIGAKKDSPLAKQYQLGQAAKNKTQPKRLINNILGGAARTFVAEHLGARKDGPEIIGGTDEPAKASDENLRATISQEEPPSKLTAKSVGGKVKDPVNDPTIREPEAPAATGTDGAGSTQLSVPGKPVTPSANGDVGTRTNPAPSADTGAGFAPH